MKCVKCENIEKDPITGMLICLTCGNVVEESSIVQGIEFDNNQKATGTFIDANKSSYFTPGGFNTLSQMIDPTQMRLNKVYKYMVQVATVLTIPTSVLERAKRLYNIASNKKFTQGRKTKQIVGAILYLACRLHCTKHLLIDFSEVLQINLFVIGSAYLKLVKLLSMTVKVIDPSLYMHRFCNKLGFGLKAREVENTALKIMQFLKRDWITTGRRPSGLCGACLLISAKLHGFRISIDEVSAVVRVCNETIKKRILEFSLTKVAMMSKEEFEKFETSHFYLGCNPPAFTRNREKEEKENEQKENKDKTKEEKDNSQKENENSQKEVTYENKQQEKDINKNNTEESDNKKEKDKEVNNTSDFEDEEEKEIPENVEKTKEVITNQNEQTKPNEDVFLAPLPVKPKSVKSETEFLSTLEEKDEMKYLYTENEYVVRKHIWEIMYKDWLDEQKEKKMMEKLKPSEPKKIRIRKISTASTPEGSTPYEAIKNSTKFGKKINYNFVKTLFRKKKI